MRRFLRSVFRPQQPATGGVGHSSPHDHGDKLAGAVTALAGFGAMAISLAIPLAYFIAAHGRIAGVVELRTELFASAVADIAGQSPALWNALLSGEGASDTEMDVSGVGAGASNDPEVMVSVPEHRRVFARDGHAINTASGSPPLDWPTLSRRLPIVQSGHEIGQVEIARSFRSVALMTAVTVVAGFVVGLALLLVLRIVPLRLMREALRRASYLSAHDALTGLPNRTLLADRLEQALASASRSGAQVALLCLDLDNFKFVNDTLGHAVGDTLLCSVATRLRAGLREENTLARVGGDEFVIIVTDVYEPLQAERIATRLIEIVRAPIVLDGQQIFVGLSVGIALGHGDVAPSELTMQADMALYQAKEAGRGIYRFFSPEMNERLQRRRVLENDLRRALEAGEITLHYQPQVASVSGGIIGAEALMRWTRAGEGPISPAVFIPLAEEIGVIGILGEWLLQEACREAATWPAPMSIAVNVSPVQFRLGNFIKTVRGALAASKLDPSRLELEVTEGILLNETEETLAIFSELRAIGVRIAMDDFGTGYSSLGYLQKFRFDKIKIDKSFVAELGSNINSAAIVRAVVGLSQALGLTINAEGVENDEQIALLRAYGCQEMQGFHYWAPMPAEELHPLIMQMRKPGVATELAQAFERLH